MTDRLRNSARSVSCPVKQRHHSSETNDSHIIQTAGPANTSVLVAKHAELNAYEAKSKKT